ncbi:MAG: ATP-binding protein [Candidatus Kapabacteria bacterium]|nr:ATP-binding protein [Candidatus Kapabacteria bacterium]
MIENNQYEKKSLKLIDKKNPDWNELTKDCISFANSLGGKIIIGIEDNEEIPPINQKIDDNLIPIIRKNIEQRAVNLGVEVYKIIAENGSEIIEILIKRNKNSIASTSDGKYYIRFEDTCKPLLPDELLRLLTDKSSFNWEMQQYLKVSRTDYDIDKFRTLMQNIRRSSRVSDFVKQKKDDELLDYYLFADGEYLTNLGILWIGKRIHRAKLLYSPTIQFIKYDDKQQKVKKYIWDDYSLNPEELIHSIYNTVTEFQDFLEFPDGIYRKKIFIFDEVVIRELIANAIVHRPYTTRGDIFINLYNDRLEVHNPGLLPFGVTPKNILHQSVQRNPYFAKLYYDLMIMEREGSGYDKIYETLLSTGKDVPIVEERDDRVIVTVKKAIVNKDVINFIDKINSEFQLTSKELISLSFIALHNSLSLIELSTKIGRDEQIVSKDWIQRLVEIGILKAKGKSKGVTYYVEPNLLRKANYKGRTNLKSIEPYRLSELIREDLRKFPKSSRQDIHHRIGKEIPERTLRNQLKIMLDSNVLQKVGDKKWTKYLLTE